MPPEAPPMLGSLQYQCSFNRDSGIFGDVTDRTIGQYRLGKTLGHSFRTKIKMGIHRVTGERVALKCVRRDDGNHHANPKEEEDDVVPALFEEPLRRLHNEVTVLRALSHQHVIGLVDFQEEALYPKAVANKSHSSLFGSPSTPRESNVAVSILTLDLAANGDLCSLLIATDALPEAVARTWFKQLHSALVAVHDFGICHRDVRPENILLDGSFNVKLSGFGLSASCGERQHTPCGSLQYMAPEMATANTHEDYCGMKADAWSAAVVLFLMLTGRLPLTQPMPSDCCYRLLLRDRARFWSIWEQTSRCSDASSVGTNPNSPNTPTVTDVTDEEAKTATPGANNNSSNNGSPPSADAPASPPMISEGAKAVLDAALVPDVHQRSTLRALASHPWMAEDVLPAKAVVRWMHQFRNRRPSMFFKASDELSIAESPPDSPRGLSPKSTTPTTPAAPTATA